jgi:hypothetical protein
MRSILRYYGNIHWSRFLETTRVQLRRVASIGKPLASTEFVACDGSRSSLVVYDMIALSAMSVIAKVTIGVEK